MCIGITELCHQAHITFFVSIMTAPTTEYAELQFKNDPLIELKRADDSSVATLRRGYSYNEVKAYAFLRFTRMVNISGAGIGVSE